MRWLEVDVPGNPNVPSSQTQHSVDLAMRRLHAAMRRDGTYWKIKHSHYFEKPAARRVRIKESRDSQFKMQAIQDRLAYIEELRKSGR